MRPCLSAEEGLLLHLPPGRAYLAQQEGRICQHLWGECLGL